MARATGRPGTSAGWPTRSRRTCGCSPMWTIRSTKMGRRARPPRRHGRRDCCRHRSRSEAGMRDTHSPSQGAFMTRTTTRYLASGLVAALAIACSAGDAPPAADGTQAATGVAGALTGAGATFPNPIYTKWFDEYNRQTGVRINYQSIGSGGGIRQFTEGTVDFGATDGPMTDEQIAAVNGNVLHVPTVLGAVVVTYNLPSLGATKLKFDGNVLVDIFMGRVTKWSDRRIAALNPGVKLPDIDLIVV